MALSDAGSTLAVHLEFAAGVVGTSETHNLTMGSSTLLPALMHGLAGPARHAVARAF